MNATHVNTIDYGLIPSLIPESNISSPIGFIIRVKSMSFNENKDISPDILWESELLRNMLYFDIQ